MSLVDVLAAVAPAADLRRRVGEEMLHGPVILLAVPEPGGPPIRFAECLVEVCRRRGQLVELLRLVIAMRPSASERLTGAALRDPGLAQEWSPEDLARRLRSPTPMRSFGDDGQEECYRWVLPPCLADHDRPPSLHPCSGLPDRATLRSALDTYFTGAQNGWPEGTVLAAHCDLDGFTRLNEVQGWAVGDRVLKVVGSILLDATASILLGGESGSLPRSADLWGVAPDGVLRSTPSSSRFALDRQWEVFHSGPDEFALIAWGDGVSDARLDAWATAVLMSIARTDWPQLSPSLHVRASIGLGSAEPPTPGGYWFDRRLRPIQAGTIEDALVRAGLGCRAAKAHGGGTCMWGPRVLDRIQQTYRYVDFSS